MKAFSPRGFFYNSFLIIICGCVISTKAFGCENPLITKSFFMTISHEVIENDFPIYPQKGIFFFNAKNIVFTEDIGSVIGHFHEWRQHHQ